MHPQRAAGTIRQNKAHCCLWARGVDRKHNRGRRSTGSRERASGRHRTRQGALHGLASEGACATARCKEALAAHSQARGRLGIELLQATRQAYSQLETDRLFHVLQARPREPRRRPLQGASGGEILQDFPEWLFTPACRRDRASSDLSLLLQLNDSIGHFWFMRRQFVVLGVRPAGDLHKSPGCGGRIIGLRRLYEMESAAREEEAVVSEHPS